MREVWMQISEGVDSVYTGEVYAFICERVLLLQHLSPWDPSKRSIRVITVPIISWEPYEKSI